MNCLQRPEFDSKGTNDSLVWPTRPNLTHPYSAVHPSKGLPIHKQRHKNDKYLLFILNSEVNNCSRTPLANMGYVPENPHIVSW